MKKLYSTTKIKILDFKIVNKITTLCKNNILKINVFQRAFTLLELLITIAIIGIISSIVFLTVSPQKNINKGSDVKIKANLKSASLLAKMFYYKDNNFSYSQEEGEVCDYISSDLYDNCNNDNNQWVLESSLNDGSLWCVDSLGYTGPPPRNSLSPKYFFRL